MSRFLLPFSLAYRTGCLLNNFLVDRGVRRSFPSPLPLVSVGNISFGGTEKTPLAVEILAFYLERGMKPALISRGYKGKWERNGGVLSDGKNMKGTWREAGDEPFMVAAALPRAGVYVGKHRLRSLQKAKADGFEIGVLDDGFQYRVLRRDLDVVLFDPREKNLLRESPRSLRRADIVLVKDDAGTAARSLVRKLAPRAAVFAYSVQTRGVFSLKDRTPVTRSDLDNKRRLAFCAIARPERFLSLLRKEGLEPHLFLRFPDHHPFPPASIRKILNAARRSRAQCLLTTEKDAVKLKSLEKAAGLPTVFLKIGLEVEKDFYKILNSRPWRN